ncbi:hypothetical protein CTEN210_16619 [Chaetoceros tenuissimus]|uniref:Uncharacterized protein n=1 Tax=Chaetoceros tenuissimus TaxID=426638 RepID=A0AAD3D9A1_9STRA|nr:hypothetical protein CTEN210_16619 [Chaetoceros tenuissimus]
MIRNTGSSNSKDFLQNEIRFSTLCREATQSFEASFIIPVLKQELSLTTGTCSDGIRSSPTRNFDEGAYAFTGPVSLISLYVDKDTNKSALSLCHNSYSYRITQATHSFNLGSQRAHESDYKSARRLFHDALSTLQGIDLTFLDSFPPYKCSKKNTTIQEQIFASLNILLSLTLLNVGHVEWNLSKYERSIFFYNLCLESLKSLDMSLRRDSSCREYLTDCRSIMAACLNCIGMFYIKTRLTTLIETEASEKDIQAQAIQCLGYLEKSLSIHKDMELHDELTASFLRANMATVLNNIGRVYCAIGNFTQAFSCHHLCLEKRLKSLDHKDMDVGVAYFNSAESLRALGYETKALHNYLAFLSILIPIVGYADDNVVKTVLIVSDLYVSLDQSSEAESLIQECLSSLDFEKDENLPSKIRLLNTLGDVLIEQDKESDALDALLDARDLFSISTDNVSLTKNYVKNSCSIAKILVERREFEEALTFYLKALQKAMAFKEGHCGSAFKSICCELHLQIANIYDQINDFKAASFHLRQLIALKADMGDDDYQLSTTLNLLGLTYYKANEYTSALSAFIKCATIRTKSNASKSEIIAVLYNIATVYKSIGKSDKALEIYIELLEYERELLHSEEGVAPHPPKDFILTLRQIFEIYDQDLGKTEEGLKYLLEAVDTCKVYKDYVEDSLGLGMFRLAGDTLSSLNHSSEAFSFYCEGFELFGNIDENVIASFGERGIHLLLAQACNDDSTFPKHAAAA